MLCRVSPKGLYMRRFQLQRLQPVYHLHQYATARNVGKGALRFKGYDFNQWTWIGVSVAFIVAMWAMISDRPKKFADVATTGDKEPGRQTDRRNAGS
ncbi:hypothetical protein IWW34DRAFT_894094, partial [Fusarium oxysporum f. sp. albedinis]|uniref:Uncharacterized protein n=1 Tax=Fusarium oxysporum (strain Fo5176) TaxID=660025 RepID=F9G1C6_FUSOF